MRRRLQWLCGEVPVGLVALLAVVGMALASATQTYAQVWVSDPTLWAYAVTKAPEKPRVLNNHAVMLVAQGRLEEARVWLERAHAAGHAAHLPAWDHVEGELRARENLVALRALMDQVASR